MCSCDEFFEANGYHHESCELAGQEETDILDPGYFTVELTEATLSQLEAAARAAQEVLLTACEDPFEPWQVAVPELAPNVEAVGTLWRVVDSRGEGVARISSADGLNQPETKPLADYLATVHPAIIRELIKSVHASRAATQRLAEVTELLYLFENEKAWPGTTTPIPTELLRAALGMRPQRK